MVPEKMGRSTASKGTCAATLDQMVRPAFDTTAMASATEAPFPCFYGRALTAGICFLARVFDCAFVRS